MLNPSQRNASNPQASVWVSASAGTGKTKVLISRLLRLMLQGGAPEKILCMTFTKPAAAEILDRLQQITRAWALMESGNLAKELEALGNTQPDAKLLQLARNLFARILNVPGGMRIMTIHAFCQSVLSRFPIEANIPTHFTVADDAKTSELMNLAKHHLLWDGQEHAQDFMHFMNYLDEDKQNALLQNILAKRYYLYQIMEHYPTRDAYKRHLHDLFGLAADLDMKGLEHNFHAQMPSTELKAAFPVLYTSASEVFLKKLSILEQNVSAPILNIEEYCIFFVTKEDGTPRKSLLPKMKKENSALVGEFMQREQARIAEYLRHKTALKIIHATVALYQIANAILHYYQNLKKMQSVLDYEDQISATCNLLCDSTQYQWVLYKLDNQIEHLLIDEAQDTSPAQWDIVDAVTNEFFVGEGRYPAGSRTVFVVGDEKQSIFSFQNADPEGFFQSGEKLAEKTSLNKIPLNENFRSSPLILSLVDQVFADSAFAQNITRNPDKVTHSAFKTTLPGAIHLWPKVAREEDVPSYLQQFRLAQKIADHVQELLKNPENKAGDVMILVNRRAPMAAKIMKAFKDRNIPISGPDRTILNEHLAVKDCLSFIQFVLNPQDNYNTACFLKSPFIGLDDEALFALRYKDLEKSIADNLFSSEYTSMIAYLQKMTGIAQTESAMAFIHTILDQPCPYDERSGRHALIKHLGYDTEDILENFVDTAYHFDSTEPAQLQNFYNMLVQKTDTLKQEQSDMDKSYVQLMTVHSSKGLQAKIVILADSTSKPTHYRFDREVLWLEDPKQGFIWPVESGIALDVVDTIKTHFKRKSFAEYYRLLYVAMTRAEQELIICGFETTKEAVSDYEAWYDIVKNAVDHMAASGTYKKSSSSIFGREALSLTFAGEKTDIVPTAKKLKAEKTALMDVLRTKPPAEQIRTRPLRPSQPFGNEPAALSPLDYSSQAQNFQRGQLLHRLFRVVPDLENPAQAIEEILQNEKYLSSSNRKKIRDEVLSVFQNPEFAGLFSSQARGEVPLVGEIILDGKPYAVSGQVDRLLVTNKNVMIVDYKTNRPPAMNEEDVAEIYRMQMLSYKLLLQNIYPDKNVKTAILWTSVPYLLPLSL